MNATVSFMDHLSGSTLTGDIGAVTGITPYHHGAPDSAARRTSTAGSTVALIRILDQCGVMALLMSRDFNARHVTAGANTLLALGSPIKSQHGYICCSAAPLEFRRAVLAGFSARGSMVDISDDHNHESWTITVVPLPYRIDLAVQEILLVIRRQKILPAHITADRIRVAMALTPVESELVAALSNGHTTRAYADLRNVSIHTVRNQLKSIYNKLDIHSQKDLIAETLRSCDPTSRKRSTVTQGVRR